MASCVATFSEPPPAPVRVVRVIESSGDTTGRVPLSPPVYIRPYGHMCKLNLGALWPTESTMSVYTFPPVDPLYVHDHLQPMEPWFADYDDSNITIGYDRDVHVAIKAGVPTARAETILRIAQARATFTAFTPLVVDFPTHRRLQSP